MQRKKISLLVILYGKNFSESETLKNIVCFEHKIDNLVIVNNGPIALKSEDGFLNLLKLKHHHVCFREFLENKPLSWIYNEFVEEFISDYYVIFDDDTIISKETESSIFGLNDIDIELPKIYAQDKKQYYPIVNGDVLKSNGLIEGFCEVYSIGSGLIFSKKVKDYFEENNIELFDSNFALYGVDTSFFMKINELICNGIIFKMNSSIVLEHSLSRAENEISEWRAVERLYDQILTIKYYKNYKLIRLLKIILKTILKKETDINKVGLILRVYNSGRHPRCMLKDECSCM